MQKIISIVISAFNEEGCVEELAIQLKKVFAQNNNYTFEVIMVDNGSTDRTFEKLFEIHRSDDKFRILQLARNFGMDGGITAGLKYAKGDAAVIMTANLQDTPSLITEFIKKWEEGYENVYGIVKKRTGKGLIRRMNSQIFYFIINRMTGSLIPKNVSDFRLVDRKIYQTINVMDERNRFLRGMFAWVGFKSVGIEYERGKRFAGKSHALSKNVFSLAIRGIFAFSYVPIRFIAASGFLLSLFSFIFLIISILGFFIKGVPFKGYGMIVSLIVFMFSLVFFILGILGQYIAQIYEEVKARPNYIVKKLVGLTEAK